MSGTTVASNPSKSRGSQKEGKKRGRKDKEDAPPPKRTKPTPTETPAQATPFDPPCKNCLRSAISGKGTPDRCIHAPGRSNRCAPCKAGNHRCTPCPRYAAPLARRLVVVMGDPALASQTVPMRRTLGVVLDLMDDQPALFDECDREDMPSHPAKEDTAKSANEQAAENLTAAFTAFMSQMTKK